MLVLRGPCARRFGLCLKHPDEIWPVTGLELDISLGFDGVGLNLFSLEDFELFKVI